MNRYYLIPFLFLFFNLACSQDEGVVNMDSELFYTQIKKNPGTLLDVRTSSEYANGYIKGAGQLNYYERGFAQKLLLLPKDQPVYLYCNTGFRSKKAAKVLAENGYKQVYNLNYGIMGWELNNMPIEKTPDIQVIHEDKMEPDEFAALIESEQAVFIDFYAPWCAPCRQMMPMIDSLKQEFKEKILVVKINADASKKLVKHLKLQSVPYFLLFQKNEKIFEHNGIISRQTLVELFNEQ